MAQAILSKQLKSLQLNKFYQNLSIMKLGNRYLFRSILESFLPGLEYNLRTKSRISRRNIINNSIINQVDDSIISLHNYNNIYNVWMESIYGVHIPHLVHYDDRNGMSCSIEGRMPFLDHRIAECVANIKTTDFLKNGLRKYILRESCKQYIPKSVYNRTDKIGFYTPLVNALKKDKNWVFAKLKDNTLYKNEHTKELLDKMNMDKLNVNEALHIWRCLSVIIWMNEYKIKLN